MRALDDAQEGVDQDNQQVDGGELGAGGRLDQARHSADDDQSREPGHPEVAGLDSVPENAALHQFASNT